METATDRTQRTYREFLRRIVILVSVILVYQLFLGSALFVLLLKADATRQEILDCTAADRVNSKCQRDSNARTGAAISQITKQGAAYVLCADRLDGDEIIKACVQRLLRDEASR